jgi:hypothetical protein
MNDAQGPPLLGLLSIHCSPSAIGDLYDYFHTRSKGQILQECQERKCKHQSCDHGAEPLTIPLASLLSNSERSSIISCLSPVSSDATSSSGSRKVTARTSYQDTASVISNHVEEQYDNRLHTVNKPDDLPSTPQSIQNSPHPGTLVHIPSTIVEKVWHVCITCSKKYSTRHKLQRHHEDKCECEGVYVCPDCPESMQQTFERWDRFMSHIRSHRGKCDSNCTSTNGKSCPVHLANIDKSSNFRLWPQKVAWGCPVCLNCFVSRKQWLEHEKTHYKDIVLRQHRDSCDVDVKGWAVMTRLKSLLFKSKVLGAATSKYNWDVCHWPLSTDAFENLFFALERLTLPAQISVHDQYKNLNATDAIVDYAFRLGLSGMPHSVLDLDSADFRSKISLPYSGSFSKPLPSRIQISSQHVGCDAEVAGPSYGNVGPPEPANSSSIPLNRTIDADFYAQPTLRPQTSRFSTHAHQTSKPRDHPNNTSTRTKSTSSLSRR